MMERVVGTSFSASVVGMVNVIEIVHRHDRRAEAGPYDDLAIAPPIAEFALAE